MSEPNGGARLPLPPLPPEASPVAKAPSQSVELCAPVLMVVAATRFFSVDSCFPGAAVDRPAKLRLRAGVGLLAMFLRSEIGFGSGSGPETFSERLRMRAEPGVASRIPLGTAVPVERTAAIAALLEDKDVFVGSPPPPSVNVGGDQNDSDTSRGREFSTRTRSGPSNRDVEAGGSTSATSLGSVPLLEGKVKALPEEAAIRVDALLLTPRSDKTRTPRPLRSVTPRF